MRRSIWAVASGVSLSGRVLEQLDHLADFFGGRLHALVAVRMLNDLHECLTPPRGRYTNCPRTSQAALEENDRTAGDVVRCLVEADSHLEGEMEVGAHHDVDAADGPCGDVDAIGQDFQVRVDPGKDDYDVTNVLGQNQGRRRVRDIRSWETRNRTRSVHRR